MESTMEPNVGPNTEPNTKPNAEPGMEPGMDTNMEAGMNPNMDPAMVSASKEFFDNMESGFNREYKFKAYLNCSHFIIINGKEGQVHPHTWEFTICVTRVGSDFIQFNAFEKAIEEFIAPYQNRIVNEIPPFDKVVPTLENVSDYFGDNLRRIIRGIGGEVILMESSETPTRSYVLDYEEELDFMDNMKQNSKEVTSMIIDSVLDGIIGDEE